MRKIGFLVLVAAFFLPGALFAQSGKETVSGELAVPSARYLVYMNVVEERGLMQVRSFVLENANSGTYSFARNRYDGKKSKLEIVASGSFVINGDEIVFTPAEGNPVKGTKTDRYINVDDEYYLICEDPVAR